MFFELGLLEIARRIFDESPTKRLRELETDVAEGKEALERNRENLEWILKQHEWIKAENERLRIENARLTAENERLTNRE